MPKETLHSSPNQQLSPTQQLIDHLARERVSFVQRITNSFSNSYDLAKLYGIDPDTVCRVAQAQGYSMRERQRQTSQRREVIYSERLITPAHDTAWLLGVLCGAGSTTGRRVTITSHNMILLDRFHVLGESIFQLKGRKTPAHKTQRRNFATVSFSDTALAPALGNLRKDSWPDTIISKYPWILKEDAYGWKFLEGLFETLGIVSLRGSIRIHTQHIFAADFISKLLVGLGLNENSVRLVKDKSKRKGIAGIDIHQIDAIRYLAQRIEILDGAKKDMLIGITNINLSSHHRPRDYEELIIEWLKLKKLLGKTPSEHQINEMRKKGLTRFSDGVYKSWFSSELGNKRSFFQTRANIEAVIRLLESGDLASPADIPKILALLPKEEKRTSPSSSEIASGKQEITQQQAKRVFDTFFEEVEE